MSKPQVKIYNCETGEEIIQDATAAQIQQLEADAEKALNKKLEAEAKAAAKEAAQSKLAALGLTVEDLTALGL
jgi:hypothetical protein